MTLQQNLVDYLNENYAEILAQRDRAAAALEAAEERVLQHKIHIAIAKHLAAYPDRYSQKPSVRGALRHSHYIGVQARVAKSLGVSRLVVCRVMKGQKKSRRVTAALTHEYARRRSA